MPLALPTALAHDLYVSFLGLEPDAAIDDRAVRDLVGELANMTCGSWLTGVHATSCFDLTHPDVQVIDAAPPTGVVVMIDYQPVVIGAADCAGYAMSIAPAQGHHRRRLCRGPQDARRRARARTATSRWSPPPPTRSSPAI